MMIHEVILRNINSMRQAAGNLFVFDGTSLIFHCKTLELPYKENTPHISCIISGFYRVSKHYSHKFGACFIIENVYGREQILQRCGKYSKDVGGDQLLGEAHTDMNDNGLIDVTRSRETLKRLYDILPEEFTLRIMSVCPKSANSERKY